MDRLLPEAWLFDGLVGHIGCAHRSGAVEDIIGRSASHYWNAEMLAEALAGGVSPGAVIIGESSSSFALAPMARSELVRGVPILVNRRRRDGERWPNSVIFDGSAWIRALVRFARDHLDYLNPRWEDALTDPRLD